MTNRQIVTLILYASLYTPRPPYNTFQKGASLTWRAFAILAMLYNYLLFVVQIIGIENNLLYDSS